MLVEAAVVTPTARPPLVGRQRELATLVEHLAAAGRGEGGVVLVGGEPGIGKTRLIQALVEHAAAGGWTVLTGRAYEAEGQPPYLPIIEALRDSVRNSPPDLLRTQLGRGAAQLALLMPGLADRIPDLLPSPPLSLEAERYHLFESVADFLGAIARSCSGDGGGLLLALDDLQWADTPTLRLLQHLARRLAGAPVLITGTYRTVGLEPGDPFSQTLAELRREGFDERLLLGPLALDDVAELIIGLTGVASAATVAEGIHRETEGNAFFAGELVRHLVMEGRTLTDPDAAVAAWGIPTGVREVIGARLARLSTGANQLLQAAAVRGDDSTFEVIAAASGLSVAGCMEAMDEALVAGMLHERGMSYQFSHALVRQTLYEGLPLHRRQSLHLRVAAALEAVSLRDGDAPLAALAAHYRLAGPAADPRKALMYSRQAGDAAAAVFAWEDAIPHWQAALDRLGPDQHASSEVDNLQRCELLLALGTAQERAGAHDASLAAFQQACDLARTLPVPELFAQGALEYAEIITNRRTGRMHQPAVDLLEEALDAVGVGETALRARLQSCLAYALYWSDDPERREALSAAALAAARRAGDPATLAYVLNQHCQTLQSLCHFDARHVAAIELVTLGEQMKSRNYVLAGQFWCIAGYLEAGDTAAAKAALDVHGRMADELRSTFYQMLTMAWRATFALLAGELAESETHAEEVRAVWRRTAGEASQPWFLMHRFILRRAQGRLAEVEGEVLEAAARRPDLPLSRLNYALVLSLTGRESEAHAEFAALTALDLKELAGSAYQFQAASALSEICATLRDRTRAPALYALLRPFAGRNAVVPFWPGFRGAVDHYLGLLAATLGESDAAADHFDAALAMHERVGARPYLARTRHAYADLLLARGRTSDLARARALLEEAVTAFDAIGMVQDAAAARALLAGSRAAVAPPRPTYPDGLSAREVEVLRLIAAGKGNQEIAGTLVISRNTVLRHVNHIYAKSGAANRVELANYAHRHGLTG